MNKQKLGRRSFLASGAAGLHGLAGAQESKLVRKHRFIDIHTHVGTFYWQKPLTADGLLRLMDRHGIREGLVSCLWRPLGVAVPADVRAGAGRQQTPPGPIHTVLLVSILAA